MRWASGLVEAGRQYRGIRLTRAVDFEELDTDQLREINGEGVAEAVTAVHGRLNITE